MNIQTYNQRVHKPEDSEFPQVSIKVDGRVRIETFRDVLTLDRKDADAILPLLAKCLEDATDRANTES